MPTSEHAPKGRDTTQPSQRKPVQPAKETGSRVGDESGDDLVRRILQEKLKARGKLPPPPPGPPPAPTTEPLMRKLIDAGGKIIYEKFSCYLVKHACGTKVTKFHLNGLRRSEVEAMRFISKYTTIPVPHVYETGERHFTMDFIKGETLAHAWEKTLSDKDRALVCRQLRDYVKQLRALKSPDGVICSFGGGPAINSRLFRNEGGPFPTEAAYNDFLVSDLNVHSSIRNMIRTQMRGDHEIVFSHGDLHAINIMVRPGAGVVAIIDWELAGYYPEYHDLIRTYLPADWNCGYYKELLNIFPQRYDAEFVVAQLIATYISY